MTEYIQTPIYEISSPMIWSTMIYKSLDKALAKMRTLIEEHSDCDEFPISLNCIPHGRIAKGFNEDTQSIETESIENESAEPTSDTDSIIGIVGQENMTEEMSKSLDKAYELFNEDAPRVIVETGLREIQTMYDMARDIGESE